VFCAVPVSMAMATLALCFMNPEMFRRNIKIRKAEAAHVRGLVLPSLVVWCLYSLQLIMRSTNTREVALIFREYARKIHHKAKPHDPNFLKISVMCCKVRLFPSFHFLTSPHSTLIPISLLTPLLPDRAMVRTKLPLLRIPRPERHYIRSFRQTNGYIQSRGEKSCCTYGCRSTECAFASGIIPLGAGCLSRWRVCDYTWVERCGGLGCAQVHS
jgi:hypothetical protein